MFDAKKLEEIIIKHPDLSLILRAGVISRKMAAKLLDLDKWLMDDLYADLLKSGSVRGVSSGNFKATTEAIAYLEERCDEEYDDE